MTKDLFSGHSKAYASFRPTYPQDFYEFIFKEVAHFDQAWDVGTGNGQVAVDLSRYFKSVQATDISEKQLQQAPQIDTVFYQKCKAEQSPFENDSFDLITIGQAIHWFDRDLFYEEAKRVGKPNSIIAAFGYNPVQFTPEFNTLLHHFYYDVIYSYWDAARKIVEDKYSTMSFPFKEIQAPDFKIPLLWSLTDLHGYLTTWSSVQKFIRENGFNPVDNFMEEVKGLWRTEVESVYFPLFLRLGRIIK